MKTCAIIMTAFKSEDYILMAIESLKFQNLPDDWNIEFYIGVDGCVETSEFLKNKPISHYYSRNNVGTYVLSNTLIRKALDDGCECFLRFDSDDVACDNFIKYGILNCEKYNFSRTFCKETDTNLNPCQRGEIKYANGSSFFNREALLKLGGYHNLRLSCDSDFRRRANDLGYIPEEYDYKPVYLYRRHANSLTFRRETTVHSELRNRAIIFMNKYYKQGKTYVSPEVTEISYWQSDT